MGFWETVGATLLGGVLAAIAIGALSAVWVWLRARTARRPAFRLHRRTPGAPWRLQSLRDKQVTEFMLSLGYQGKNVSPHEGREYLPDYQELNRGMEVPLPTDRPWDEVHASWYDTPRRRIHTVVKGDQDEYLLFASSRPSRFRDRLRKLLG